MFVQAEVSDEVLDRLRHRVDVAGRAGDGLRQHAALAVEDAGREVARLAHDRREGRAQQRLRLLLHHGDQPVPHDLQVDVADGPAHAVVLLSLASGARGQHQGAAGIDGEVEARRDVGGRAVLDDERRALQRGARGQVARARRPAPQPAAEARIEDRALAERLRRRLARRRGRAAAGGSVVVVASTTQLMISISALGMWRAKRRVYSRSKSARKVAASLP